MARIGRSRMPRDLNSVKAKQQRVIDLHDTGMKPDEIAREVGYSDGGRTVAWIIEREQIRRDTAKAVDPEKLSKNARARVDAVVRQERKRLFNEFGEVVRQQVVERVNEVLATYRYRETLAEAERVIAARDGALSEDEFRLLLAVAHPDNSASIERRAEAFKLLKDKKLELVKDEIPRDTRAPLLPQTWAEWEARKAQVKAERAAKRKARTATG